MIVAKQTLHPIFTEMTISNTVEIDFSINNEKLKAVDLLDTSLFSSFVESYLSERNAIFGIGGYNEHRGIYQRSAIFNSEESRCIYLGIDVWTKAATPVFLPLDGEIHSLANNKKFGDYGPTIIVSHLVDEKKFHTLYGHLDKESLKNFKPGDKVRKGSKIARVGNYPENGNWPPHLHFQLIIDMEGRAGDYPGVCKISERLKYLENCPDPSIFF
jgi:peptidoglycan LD-endopeptidase LytH